MRLYNRDWDRRQLEARVGRLEQIGGLRKITLSEGPDTSVEQFQVRTGAGLTYYVSASRCLDISLAEFCGVPLSWQSPNSDVHPSYFEPNGAAWLRTATGGLLMTCGLTQVGAPCEDEGQHLGLHGRIHHTPARQVSATGNWSGNDYKIMIGGVMEETSIFGEKLHLRRQISSSLGSNVIQVVDVIENLGFQPSPLMLLYHFNFGFPLLSENTRISFPSQRVIPRDNGIPLEGYDRWESPQSGYVERVYYHEDIRAQTGSDGDSDIATVTIRNPKFPRLAGQGTCALSVKVSWSMRNLPRLVQWKMAGQGEHVLGIEPANCYVEGRAKERERGTLVTLAPGASLTYQLKLEVTCE